MTLTADAPVLARLSRRAHQAGRVGRRAAWRFELRHGALIPRHRRIGEHDGDSWPLVASAEHCAQLLWPMPSYEGGERARCSPGRLLLQHLLQVSFEQGLREFDFTIGDEPSALCDASDALCRMIGRRSALGWACDAKSRLWVPPLRGLIASNGPARQRHGPRHA